jgi:anti-sigma factor RsiW
VKPERLDELIDGHLEGALTEPEAQELSAMLAANKAARREFWARASIHGLLPEAVHLAWLAEATPVKKPNVIPMPGLGVSTRVLGVLRYATLAGCCVRAHRCNVVGPPANPRRPQRRHSDPGIQRHLGRTRSDRP